MKKSLKIALTISLVIFSGFLFVTKAQEEKHSISPDAQVNVYLFYSISCPHCAKEKAFLEELSTRYSPNEVKVYTLEISEDKYSRALFMLVGEELKADISGVPFLLIGEKYIVGFNDASTTGIEIEKEIQNALENKPRDVVYEILYGMVGNPEPEKPEPVKPEPLPELPQEPELEPTTEPATHPAGVEDNESMESIDIHLPVVGTINSKDFSLPVLTFVIALLDGFNPCAMWVLLFLIGTLMSMENRKRMWLLGSTFIAASGFVYFMFMAAWLNFFLFIGYSAIVNNIIGILALMIGLHYLNEYRKKVTGCVTVSSEKRKKVFNRIKLVVQEKQLLLALIGIILLAFAVNIVELFCSAGLPAVYTRVLTLSELTKVQYYSYLAFYILIFMLDDLLIFAISMFTLKLVGVESKYSRFSRLIGGLVMLGLGFYMLF